MEAGAQSSSVTASSDEGVNNGSVSTNGHHQPPAAHQASSGGHSTGAPPRTRYQMEREARLSNGHGKVGGAGAPGAYPRCV